MEKQKFIISGSTEDKTFMDLIKQIVNNGYVVSFATKTQTTTTQQATKTKTIQSSQSLFEPQTAQSKQHYGQDTMCIAVESESGEKAKADKILAEIHRLRTALAASDETAGILRQEIAILRHDADKAAKEVVLRKGRKINPRIVEARKAGANI
jgi:hypothetical protein